MSDARDYSWQCNQCGSDEYSSSIGEDAFDDEALACSGCGGTEFHKVFLESDAAVAAVKELIGDFDALHGNSAEKIVAAVREADAKEHS